MNNTNFRKAFTDLTAKIDFYDEKIALHYNNTHPDFITSEGAKDLASLRRNRSLYSKLQNMLLERFGNETGENNYV